MDVELSQRSLGAAEAEIDRFISRRAQQREADPDEREEGWMESTRRFHARRREQNRWEWVRHFDRMAESHARLSESYRERAEKLCQETEPTKGDAA